MKKNLKEPKYKIGDAVSFHQEDHYRVSRITGIIHYDDEYKYLFDEDIILATKINILLLVSEDDIVDKLN
jgi:hypothetical protein